MDDELRYKFIAEWFDTSIKVKRSFIVTYFPADGTVEMFDMQCKKLFLKRIKCLEVSPEDMFVGSVVNILSRQLYLVDFADQKTRERCTKTLENTILIVKSSGFDNLGIILDTCIANDLTITKARMTKAGTDVSYKSSLSIDGKFAVFELRGEYAVELLNKITGKEVNLPKPLHGEFGQLAAHCICPKNEKEAKNELATYFPTGKELYCNTGVFQDSTCCILKPHIVREGKTGKILQDITDAGFVITALQLVNFDLPMATEFYEVYKGVVPYYQEMVNQLTSGPSIGLEVVNRSGGNVVSEFRDLVGPSDAELAKKLRPNSLRAKYGQNQVRNAIHCTDLPEDGNLEVEYIFRVLPLSIT